MSAAQFPPAGGGPEASSGGAPGSPHVAPPVAKAMTRWQAFGIHIGISAAIASVVMGVLFLVWYPSAYFTAMGGDQLVYLLVGCDVVLGPLITLVIFKAGKKGLAFDLAVIGFIQAAALVYGITVAAAARPVYMVWVVDRFEVTTANNIEVKDLARVKDARYLSLPWLGPKTVAALKPTNPDDQLEMIVSGMGGKDMHMYPHLYVPYESVQEDAGRRAQPLARLRQVNPGKGAVIDEFLHKRNLKEDDVGFVALKARREMRVVMLDRKGNVLDILPLSPW